MFSCFVEDAKPPKEPPPAIFAYNVITDDEADNMELQEETESVSTTEDEIIRENLVCPPSETTTPVGFKGGVRGLSDGRQRPSVKRSPKLSKPSWNQF